MKGYEAVKWAIEEGKSIRRKRETWKDSMVHYDGKHFKWFGTHSLFSFEGDDLSSSDWEIHIEPYKVGDFVFFKIMKNEYVGEVFEEDHKLMIKWDDGLITELEHMTNDEYFRKATQGEIQNELKRRKWSKWGRKVNEWRVGDVFFEKDDSDPYEVVEVLEEKIRDNANELVDSSNAVMMCPREFRVDKNFK